MKALFLIQLALLFSTLPTIGIAKEKIKINLEQKRWNDINRLINEEIATIKMAKKISPTIMYRLFELKSEKLKLIKEKENKIFVKQKLKHGEKINRKNSFTQTLKNYNETNSYGESILNKFPNTKYKAAIYYTLALNSRDFAYDNKELAFLREAIKYSNGQEKVNYLARTSLAEYYYNQKDWKSAIYQYEIVLNNKDDEWFTKNLLNYGWCLLKDHKFGSAIDHLERSYKLSSDEFYVDVKEQAMTGLISFYVLGKEIDRGIKFIDTYSTEKNVSHLSLARKTSNKGYYAETERIISMLESRISNTSETELYADFRLFQFDFYNQYHKPHKLLEIALLLQNVNFTEYQREDAIRKVSDVVGAKQVILKKDFSKHDQEYDKTILKEIVTYFDILSKINSAEMAQYEYFKAETYYSVRTFKNALDSYKSSLISYDARPSKEDLRHKNLDAIFSCIENINYTPVKKAEVLEFAYKKYLSYWPADEKAQKIYPRLFAIYQVRNDFQQMQTGLDLYIRYFKNDLKIQQDLYRVQLDLLIKAENTELLAGKINKMQTGYLNFEKNEVKKSETILANILFGQYRKLNASGNSKEALAGYQKVHFTDYYPRSIKGEAAFNMGMIYTDIQDNSNALKWYEKSFNFYNEKEIIEKRPYLEKMAKRTALLHNFLNAANLEKFILEHYCNEKTKNLENFTNAIRNDLANDYISKTTYTIKKFSKCIDDFPISLKKEIMVHLYENKHETDLYTFIDEYNLQKEFPAEISYYYENHLWNYYKKSNIKEKILIGKLRKLNTQSGKNLINALVSYHKLKKTIRSFEKNIIEVKKSEPDPNDFIARLGKRINDLKIINEKAEKIFELGNGQVSVLVYDSLTKLTQNFSKEVLSYKMPIPDDSFQKQFKDEMIKISNQMNSETENLKNKGQELIEKYELLITKREDSHIAHDILEITDIRPRPSELAITFGLGK